VRCVNLPFLEGAPVVETLTARFAAARITLLTDAEAATWGEYCAATAVGDVAAGFVHLRIGTGVAVGAVVDGHLLRLDSDRTTHLPFLVVDESPTAVRCRCGLRGCLETMVSGPALERAASDAGLDGGIAALEMVCRTGCEGRNEAISVARAVIGRAALALAAGVRRVVDRFSADAVCLGGGVLAHLPPLENEAVGLLNETVERVPQRIRLIRARLGDDAGALGAALFVERNGREPAISSYLPNT
jgi:glucokinase